jgi:hypothetical protein
MPKNNPDFRFSCGRLWEAYPIPPMPGEPARGKPRHTGRHGFVTAGSNANAAAERLPGNPRRDRRPAAPEASRMSPPKPDCAHRVDLNGFVDIRSAVKRPWRAKSAGGYTNLTTAADRGDAARLAQGQTTEIG